jgi:hypothetical protein
VTEPAGGRAGRTRSPDNDDELAALADALVAIGVEVRDAVRAALVAAHAASPLPSGTLPSAAHPPSGGGERGGSTSTGPLGAVVRTAGGDDIFGVDDLADVLIVERLAALGERFGGSWVMEGHDEPLAVGRGDGPWRFLCDPLDGTRPLLAGKRSAWVLFGAGRGATSLEELELSVVVEVPTRRAALAMVAWATADGRLSAFDEDLATGGRTPVTLTPRAGDDVSHAFVTVVRFAPGSAAAIGAWQDRHLDGLVTFDDLVPCSAGQLMGLASGADAAVFDPRPLLAPGTMAAHPYDLAGFLVARAAGVVVEALPPGPLAVALDVDTPVAWAGYANEAVAARLRPRGPISAGSVADSPTATRAPQR